MAKGIGNGYPLGAVVTTPEIAKSVTKAFHFNTYGGNALGSAVGLAVLKVRVVWWIDGRVKAGNIDTHS